MKLNLDAEISLEKRLGQMNGERQLPRRQKVISALRKLDHFGQLRK
jgi:hypothetical protein